MRRMKALERGFAALLPMFLMLPAQAWAIDWSRVTFNGYASLEIEKQIEGKGKGRGDANLSFDAKEIDFLIGVQLHDKIRANANVIFEHGPATEDARGNVALTFGFLEYSFSDQFRLRAGKIMTPFGMFNEIHTAKIAFLSVNEPLSISKPQYMLPDAFRFIPRSGAGLSLQGEGTIGKKRWEYTVLVANGEQAAQNPYEWDENLAKSVTARVRFEPLASLRVGASYFRDRYADAHPKYRLVQNFGFELEYNRGAFQLLAEAATVSRENADKTKRDMLVWYVQPSYRLNHHVTPYVRLDFADPNRDVDDNNGTDLVIGVNYEMKPGFMVRIENNWFEGQGHSSLATYPGGDYNEIKAAIVAGW